MQIFDRRKRQKLDQLVDEYAASPSMPRREFLQRAAATGLSLSAASALLAACGGSANVDKVGVLTQWSGEELASFRAICDAFKAKNNISIDIESTRDVNAVLSTRVKGNNAPDISGMPGIPAFQDFAAKGKLVQLDKFFDMNKIKQNYTADWIKLASHNGNLYGVLPKSNTKATIWYNPTQFQAVGGTVPQTWDELIAVSDKIAGQGKYPWSMGVESSASSGWPATDWIAEIYINKNGPDMYDKWVAHKIPWTDSSIKESFKLFGQIVTGNHYINGAPQSILATNFQDASYQPFTNPAQSYMYYLGDFTAGFITSQYKDLKPGSDFNFFPFPSINPAYKGAVTGGADIMAAFKDNDATRKFMEYLSSAEAQTIWVKRGGATSVNKEVKLDDYPNDVLRQSAQQMVNASSVRVGAGDLVPASLQTAYWKAMLAYIGDTKQLDSILASLETTAGQAYES
ncbi:ABC transporter substrate-binding protein [Tengunoibacter tsumagoiensis]|uniref:ABC transporter substrate-binding protein n=1 Tax=Tengunoibacter tsumagoiensis TaxID=2014871 RepID=A0A402A3L3_9CHLR|nr:extracellular solute-binding protein [Tengunoibacter tsumagoiensis]GCE13625.1 ABC transporter substrate-binding protein [Tengunoibacter tsumagoiensis]